MSYLGMHIVPHPLAEKTSRHAVIERTAVRKRRRSWRLRYEERREPCAFVIGNTVYMHPKAYAKLKESQQ